MTEKQYSPYKEISKDYSICTLPRVGSFYLQDRILQHTGIYIKKYHSFKDNKMITVVRDPVEMLTSKLAMTAFYDKNNETIDHIRNKQDNTTDLDMYLDGLNKIETAEHFYTVIDYNDLIKHPFETTVAIANIINFPIISKEYKENTIREYPENVHLISSKKVAEYQEIEAYVEQLDLSRLYDFYNKALDKCIKIL
jgi:hypothetical protein